MRESSRAPAHATAVPSLERVGTSDHDWANLRYNFRDSPDFAPGARVAITEEELTASDGASGDNLGTAVALAGDRAIVGASRADNEAGVDAAGAAYVFERDRQGGWTEVAKLTASDGGDSDLFGASVALTGDRALVGAFRNSNDGGSLAGAAYVFEPDGQGGWTETAKLTASDGASGDEFGTAVASAGGRVIVGAGEDDTEDGIEAAGAAYLFEPDGQGGWTETAKLIASDGAAGDVLGRSVALTDDRAIVGAYYDDDAGINAGAVYVFELDEPSDADRDGVFDVADHCPATAVPETHVPAFGHLSRRRFALVGMRDGDGVALFTNRRGRAPFSIERTRGCSCEQILVRRARHLDLRHSEAVFRLLDQWFGGCYKSTLSSTAPRRAPGG